MLEKMKAYISEQLNVDESEITPEASFRDDLGADSLDLYELSMSLEDEYGITMAIEDLQEINTVGDVIDYLTSHGIEG